MTSLTNFQTSKALPPKAGTREIVNFSKIEKKWQTKWEKAKLFEVKEDKKKQKFYLLEMYPYPSASGLHIGHAFNYIIGDIYARFKRMSGFNVLHPMGFDSFGLPAENAAIKANSHPKIFTDDAIKNYIRQLKMLGISYDWTRMIYSHDPEYYKWNQYFFLKFYENHLVYRKKSPVNFCEKCDTVLANEQVIGGKCWRHTDTEIQIKHLEQWFIKTTKYADELLKEIPALDWPERIKIMQENWIGKSQGTEILFEIPLPQKTNFVLLHGYTGSPEANFFPWLKKELESRGHRVSVPKLPNPNNPNFIEQVEYILKNCEFDENTILLGHSLGGPVALKIVESLTKPIKKLILAAGFIEPNSKDKPYTKTFDWKFDTEKIKKNVSDIFILKDINDKEIRKDAATKLNKAIGGTIVEFKAEDEHICGKEEPVVLRYCLNYWPVFTTRPDTLFGVTFLVISAQHQNLMSIVTEKQKPQIEKFLKKIKSTKQEDLDKLDKEGVFTGSYAIHPLTKEKIPVWAGNFVLAEYGSGMVMAVPAHDQRDFDFAKKYSLPIKIVIQEDKNSTQKNIKQAYEGKGILINSNEFNNIPSEEAKTKITKALESKSLGKQTTQYKLRDWLISRQRYWGTPIPIVYCEKCGIVPLPESALPVMLPEKVKFGEGNPLATNQNFVNVKCPKCNSKARRETDTMDTFFDSSWYYLRFTDSKNKKQPFKKETAEYWLPVDFYTGGAEHACMHLIYARFFTKALRDLGFINLDEPFKKLFNQGMLHKDGVVMSKSKGNVVLPEEVSDRYGIDTARIFLMSIASPDKDIEWSENGVDGALRFIIRIYNYITKIKKGKSSKKLEHKINKTIKELTAEIENTRYNFAIIKLRELLEVLEQENEISKKDLESFIKIISPFCPHLAEELWEKIGNKTFVSIAQWPIADESKISNELEQQEKIQEQALEDIKNIISIIKQKQGKEPETIYLYAIPKELSLYDNSYLEKKLNKKVKIFAVNDKNLHDPEQKAKKAKPGRPGIYAE